MCFGDRCGIHFWGVHSHDGMWHLEIAAVSFKSIPFIVPTFSGAVLSGYNVLMDLVLYALSMIGIPPIITLFKIIPVAWFVFYTVTAIILSQRIHKSVLFTAIALFFLYFADSFGYWLPLIQEGSIFLGTQSFALQSLTSLLNTQFALTLPLIMTQLYILKTRKFTFKNGVFMGILVFFSMGLKFYGGVISLTIAGWYVLDELLEKRNFRKTLFTGGIMAFITGLSIVLFYNPFAAAQTGSIFIFSPFATVHSVIEASNMVYLPDMVHARYFLYEAGWSPRLVFIELFSTALYFLIHFGTRSFGFVYMLGKIILRKATRFEVYIFLTVLFAFSLNVLLIQKGDWWNTVQFGYYGIFLSNFLLAILIFDLLKLNKKLWTGLAVFIIFLTIPGMLRTAKTFMTTQTLYIPRSEVEAMKFLRDQPDGVVFTSFEAKHGYPFLDYKVSGYVSAFTGKQTYLGHLGPLVIIGVDASDRLERLKKNDCTMFKEVGYVYFVKSHKDDLIKKCYIPLKKSFNKIYETKDVTILRKK